MRKKFYMLLSIVGFIILVESALTGLLPHSRGMLYGILEAKTGPVWIAIGLFFANYLILEFFMAIKDYWILKLALNRRTKRTKELAKKNPYDKISNTPQRIQEDVKLSYWMRYKVYAEFIISGSILVQLILLNINFPMLVLSGVVYAIISIGIAVLFNPRLKKAEITEQHHEASFRSKIIEMSSIIGLPDANKASQWAAMIRMHYLVFTKVQLAIMQVLPYVVLVPMLFAGDITLGDLVKHGTTFQLIVVNAAILITFYTVYVKGTASEKRVKDLEHKLGEKDE